jgi:heme exporter protein D
MFSCSVLCLFVAWVAIVWQHYNRLAEEDRQRYEQEVKDYVPPPVRVGCSGVR